jgi:S1-C subfamily serine protease
VDLDGRIVGMNTLILEHKGGNAGIGFAIAGNGVQAIVDQLMRYGDVRRGGLGVKLETRSQDTKVIPGARVSSVASGSAAAGAGLRPGDVIVAIDGRRVADSAYLAQRLALLRIGASVLLTVMRDGNEMLLQATLGPLSRTLVPGAELSTYLDGVSFYIQESDLAGAPDRIVVDTLSDVSRAKRAGLRPGDVIISVGSQSLEKDSSVFRAEVKRAGSDRLLLGILRHGTRSLVMFQ